MSDSRGTSRFISNRKLSLVSSLGTVLIGAVALIGWTCNDRVLGSARIDYVPMAPSTGRQS
jgi:hypothetical protein